MFQPALVILGYKNCMKTQRLKYINQRTTETSVLNIIKW
jgi:hypothetical protein